MTLTMMRAPLAAGAVCAALASAGLAGAARADQAMTAAGLALPEALEAASAGFSGAVRGNPAMTAAGGAAGAARPATSEPASAGFSGAVRTDHALAASGGASGPAPPAASEAASAGASQKGPGADPQTAPQTAPPPSFRRVSLRDLPRPGARITVRIDPQAQARLLEANPAVPRWPGAPPDRSGVDPASREGPGGTNVGALDWYWAHVSPDLAAASSGRLAAAVAALSRGPGVPAPSLADMMRIADRHGAEILAASVAAGLSPALVLAVIAVESSGRAEAVSSAGATGLMQLMPAAAARFGVADRTDPAENIRGGTTYLAWLLEHFDRDPVLALAGYNAGEGAVRRHGGVPPFAETRDYVPKVLAAWNVARALCRTPPQILSDGCVFHSGARLARGE